MEYLGNCVYCNCSIYSNKEGGRNIFTGPPECLCSLIPPEEEQEGDKDETIN